METFMRPSALFSITLTAGTLFVLGCDGSKSVDPLVDIDGTASAARGSVGEFPAPSSLTAVSAGTSQIGIQWQDNSTNETGFEIQRSSSGSNGAYSVISTVAANSVAYEDVALTAATEYCYRIRAVRVTGKKSAYSPFSVSSCASTAAPPPPVMPPTPAAPSNVSATPSSESTITISWQDNSDNETGFTVFRVGFNPFAHAGPNTVTALSYALSQGVEYCYQVQAYHSALTSDGVYRTSFSAVSNTACATIPLPSAPPEGLYTISVQPTGSNVIGVTPLWNGVLSPPALRMYRSVDAGSSWTEISYPGYGTLHDYPVASEQRTCYYVIAFNAAGDGPPSNTACATAPNAPSNLVSTSVDAETFEVTWTDNSSVEEGYQVIAMIFQGSPDNAGMTEYEGGVYADVPPNSTRARVPKLTADPYSSIAYFVIAKKDGGRSDSSNMISAMEAIQ